MYAYYINNKAVTEAQAAEALDGDGLEGNSYVRSMKEILISTSSTVQQYKKKNREFVAVCWE